MKCYGINTRPALSENNATRILICISCAILLVFSACGVPKIGYAVVLWPEKGSGIEPGSIVPVTSEQNSRDTCIYFDEKSKKSVLTPVYRVERFKSKKDAETFRGKFMEFANTYAYGEKDGVPPVREQPLNTTGVKIITKPRAGQIMKIIGKSGDKAQIEEMSDYWYEVLIEYRGIGKDGTFVTLGGRGYCYGYYLKVFESETTSEKEIAKKVADMNTDAVLQNVLNNTWRPVYFQEMIERGKINTNLFNNNIGIFPLPLSNVVEIVTPRGKYNFPFTEIIKVKSDSYSFKNTSLRIEALSDKKLSATFLEDGKQVTAVYVLIDEDIEELYDRELRVRTEHFESFYKKGSVLSSSAYGSIMLDEKKRITWKNFNRLVPSVIPENVSGTGWIDFPYILSGELKKSYDGVITFYFSELKSQRNTSFAYKFADSGVRLYYVPESRIDESKVTQLGANPIVIYFAFEEG